MSVPDAWDECGYCGHDRDDHHPITCRVGVFGDRSEWVPCPCGGFTEEEAS